MTVSDEKGCRPPRDPGIEGSKIERASKPLSEIPEQQRNGRGRKGKECNGRGRKRGRNGRGRRSV